LTPAGSTKVALAPPASIKESLLRSDVESSAKPVEVELPEGRPRTTLDLAAAKLHTALDQRSGYVVVTAETSARAEALFSAVEPRLRTFRTVRVSGQALDPEAIVRALWRDGDAPFPARLAMRTLIDEARAAAQPIVVAITDAETADPARLERVRLTLEGAPDASEIVHIALLGGPELIELLRRPDTRAVAMRIGATVQVPSVSADLGTAHRAPVEPSRRAAMVRIAAFVALTSVAAWLVWRSPATVPPSVPTTPPVTAAPPVAAPSIAAVPPVTAAPTIAAAPAAVAAPVEPPSRASGEAAGDEQQKAIAPRPTAPADQAVAAPEPPTSPSPASPPASAPPVAAPVPAPSGEAAPTIAPAPSVATTSGTAVPRGAAGALQVGAFVRAASADALRARLASRFPAVAVSPATRDGTTYYRVRVTGFANAHERDAAERALRASGFSPVRVRD
jgi:hypothetical protein